MPSIPSPVNVLGQLLSGLLNYLQNQQLWNTIKGVGAYAQNVAQAVNAVLGVLIHVGQQEKGAFSYIQSKVASGTEGFAEVTANENLMWSHLIDTILPRSFRHLVGYVYSDGIVPLRVLTRDHEKRITSLEGWRDVINAWRKHFVDPNLALWVGFRQWFYQWPVGVLYIWHDWFTHPGHFGDWGAPPLVGPLINYLADERHQTSRDNLLQLLVDASPDRYRHVVAAFETMLDEQWP